MKDPLLLADMLANRVRRNLRRLEPWAAREGITCFRIFDRDIPEIPLAVDLYEGRLHAAVYARGPAAAPHPDFGPLVAALARALGVPERGVFIKTRERQKAGAQYDRMASRHAVFDVGEGGLSFRVNLSDYLDTGLFLDHRRTRAMIRAEAAGKRFLNLFSYTGAFSVYAAAGGARSTTSVDLSNTYLAWARANLARNGFTGPAHRLVRDDVMGFLAHHRPPEGGYELAVVDPPTVSRSKKMERKLDLERDHAEILNLTLDLCRKGARVYFATNFRKLKLRGPAIACSKIEDITGETAPFDFRDDRIHRTWRLVK